MDGSDCMHVMEESWYLISTPLIVVPYQNEYKILGESDKE